ncbi:hypothetical protein AMTRI_Chr02g261630 [Amborella trichopoda]
MLVQSFPRVREAGSLRFGGLKVEKTTLTMSMSKCLALKITVANAIDPCSYISELLNRSRSDKKESFEVCFDVYQETVDYLQLSVPALQQKNYIDLKVCISGSLVNPVDRQEGKDGSPLTQRNNNMTKLMLMTPDLVNYLSIF